MNLTIYERVHAYSYVYNQPEYSVIKELGFPSTFGNYQCLHNSRATFNQKKILVVQKQTALTNISNKVVDLSDSNIIIMNKAFETARKAFLYRLNLELSVLNSELKSLEIQLENMKNMTASEFTSAYGQ